MSKRNLSGSFNDTQAGKKSRGESPCDPKFWTLTSGDGYHAHGLTQNVQGETAQPRQISHTEHRLNEDVKPLLEIIYQDIMDEWPCVADTKALQQYRYYCTNDEGFTPLIQQYLQRHFNRYMNYSPPKANLLQPIKNNLNVYLPLLFRDFKTRAGSSQFRQVLECTKQGTEYNHVLTTIKKQARTCRNRAVWIGVERASSEYVKMFEKKRMAETSEIARYAVESGCAKSSDDVIVLEDNVNRICAPSSCDDQRMWSIILWTKDSENDHEPLPRKIFGGIIYGLQHLSSHFYHGDNVVAAEADSNIKMVMEKSNVVRQRIDSDGKMAKAHGSHSIYGIPYDAKPTSSDNTPIHNEKERQEAIQTDLRDDLEARHFALMSGFLPEFGQKLYATAKENNMLNRLGCPKLSTFVAYGYAASSHLDDDASPSAGWVTNRPPDLDRNSSNFVWISHAILAEMADGMRWFWLAAEDKHGSTVSREAMIEPRNVTAKFIRDNPEFAQHTTASVLPMAVIKAQKRLQLI